MEPPPFQPPGPVEEAPAVVDFEAGQTYSIQKGDTLSEVAARFGVKTRELAELNNIKNPNAIRVGQKLVLPVHAKSRPGARRQPVSAAPSRSAGPGSTYVVVAGDNLTKIAKRQGTSVKALREANNLSGDKIIVGQKLTIPGAAPAPKPKRQTVLVPISEPEPALNTPVPMAPPPEAPRLAPERAFEYTVVDGDTLETIARDFVVLKEDILEANGIADPATIRPGQKLIIPMP
jgi:LysM repeat protein